MVGRARGPQLCDFVVKHRAELELWLSYSDSAAILLDIVLLLYNVQSNTFMCQCYVWKECWKWKWHMKEGQE